MKIAIVGAGWAGCAAASQCTAHGMDVTLFDAAHLPGGRARAVNDPQLGELDNGQHLFIGAYYNTLELVRRDVGAKQIESSFKRLPLLLQSVGGQFCLKSHGGPNRSDLADVVSLWRAKGLSLRDKWRITALLHRLKTSPNTTDTDKRQALSVSQWLEQERQTENARRWLWHPLCIATLNTEPEKACARLFEKVLRDSFLNRQAGATDLLIPSHNLSELWPSTIASKVTTRWGHVVRAVVPQSHGVIIDGARFDACVLAVPAPNAARLVAPIDGFQTLVSQLSQFEFRAIATCYVSLADHEPLPAPLLMFDHAALDTSNRAQWVFDRTAFMSKTAHAQLSFVISCAEDLCKADDLSLAQALVEQLKRELPSYKGVAISARLFQEKRATFAALPGMVRPTTTTPHQRIVLAGDWTDTGYPAVVEGAVLSGIKAADRLSAIARDLS